MADQIDSEQEAALITAFVVPAKRKRLIELLSRPKRRRTALATLAHFHDLDLRYAAQIPASQQSALGIAKLLTEHGAPRHCYAISEDRKVDGRVLDLEVLLSAIVGMGFGTLVSCIPGRLGYYEGESANDRWLLEREP